MFVGTGVRAYEAGEVWHLLDQRVGMPISKIPIRNFDEISFDKYSTMVIVSGDYKFNDLQIQKIKDWASRGNTIISIGSGTKFLIENQIVIGSSPIFNIFSLLMPQFDTFSFLSQET